MADSVHDVTTDSDVDSIKLTVYPQSSIKTHACSKILDNSQLVSEVDITVECTGMADEVDCTLIWGIDENSDGGYYSSSKRDLNDTFTLKKTTGNLYTVEDKKGKKPEISFFDYEYTGSSRSKKHISYFKKGSFSFSLLPAVPFAPILEFGKHTHGIDAVEYDYSYGADIEFVKDSLKIGGAVAIKPKLPGAFNESNYKIELVEINAAIDKEGVAGGTHSVLEWKETDAKMEAKTWKVGVDENDRFVYPEAVESDGEYQLKYRCLLSLEEKGGTRKRTITKMTEFNDFTHNKTPSPKTIDLTVPSIEGLSLEFIRTSKWLNDRTMAFSIKINGFCATYAPCIDILVYDVKTRKVVYKEENKALAKNGEYKFEKKDILDDAELMEDTEYDDHPEKLKNLIGLVKFNDKHYSSNMKTIAYSCILNFESKNFIPFCYKGDSSVENGFCDEYEANYISSVIDGSDEAKYFKAVAKNILENENVRKVLFGHPTPVFTADELETIEQNLKAVLDGTKNLREDFNRSKTMVAVQRALYFFDLVRNSGVKSATFNGDHGETYDLWLFRFVNEHNHKFLKYHDIPGRVKTIQQKELKDLNELVEKLAEELVKSPDGKNKSTAWKKLPAIIFGSDVLDCLLNAIAAYGLKNESDLEAKVTGIIDKM